MRLISRKIWRAFPELDQFDDAECREYLKRSKPVANSALGSLLVICATLFALVLWVLVIVLVMPVISGMGLSRGIFVAIQFVLLTALIWLTALSGFLMRDYWVRRFIRRRIAMSICMKCGYSLIGLPMQSDAVICPECGQSNRITQELQVMLSTPADA